MLPSPSRNPAIYALVVSSIPGLPSVLPSERSELRWGFTDIASLRPEITFRRRSLLRSEPSSRTALMGEQPNPWDLIQPQDATSRHRGAKPCRRCERLGKISLLSPG